MSVEHDATGLAARLNSHLAELLSDRSFVAGFGDDIHDVDVRTSTPRVDVAVHLRRMDAFDLGRTVDARDPLAAVHRRSTPELRRELAAIERPLFAWLEESPDRPARFAHDPAQVIRALPHVDPALAMRVAGTMPRSAAPFARLAGLAVNELTVDTDVAAAPPPPPDEPVTKGTTNADAVFEIALDQLARVLDAEMIPGVRQRASRVSFDTPVQWQMQTLTQQGVLSLLLEDAADPRLVPDTMSPTDTIQVTIGFPEATLELGTGPLANAVPASLGGVEVHARLKVTAQPTGGGTTIGLGLVPGSLTVSTPADLTVIPLPPGADPALRQQLWNAAAAMAVQQLAPFYAFAAPLTFGTELCGIGPRGVTPAFRPGSMTTAPSLALFLTLAAGASGPPPTDGGPSLVPSGADGHLLLKNGLVLDLACCLLAQSDVWAGLPATPTERTTDNGVTCCKWKDVSPIAVGGESFDKLNEMRVCVDNGLSMYLKLSKSGWGWDATVEVTAKVTLSVEGGVLHVDTDTTVKVTTDVAWWLSLISVLAIIGGIALIVVSLLHGNWVGVGVGGGLVVLGLGLWTLVHLLPPDIRVPTEFDSAILDLLPGGLREKFGGLTYLTDAAWDDVALSGYMTVPNEPPLVAGGEYRLVPGQGIDLDTGEIVNAADLPTRLDVDLVLHPSPSDIGMAPASALARGVPSGPVAGARGMGSGSAGTATARLVRLPPDIFVGRRLGAFGSSRLVALTGRPYPTVSAADLRGVVFPTTVTSVVAPGRGSSPDGVTATVLAARSSAGRLAKVVVWSDQTGATWVRFRTYDTPLLVTIETDHSVQSFGKPGVTDILTILNARFHAVPAGAWVGRALTYEWFWQGTRVDGLATIDGGARMTVIDDRCTIDTQEGADLRGAVCVVVTDAAGLSVTACSNVLHIGRIPKPPDTGPGGPGGPGPGGPGPGGPGGPPTL